MNGMKEAGKAKRRRETLGTEVDNVSSHAEQSHLLEWKGSGIDGISAEILKSI